MLTVCSDAKHGETSAWMCCQEDTYGSDKLWCLLKPISIDLDSSDSEPEPDDGAQHRSLTQAKPQGSAPGPHLSLIS